MASAIAIELFLALRVGETAPVVHLAQVSDARRDRLPAACAGVPPRR
jgi:hypothetical protein